MKIVTFSVLFKIEMIDTDTDNYWALCLGQIEVFGDIYKKPWNSYKCTKQRIRRLSFEVYDY